MNPEQKFKAAKDAADAIFAKVKSENRTPTQRELDEVTKHLDEADELKKHIDASNRAKALTGTLTDDAPTMGPGVGTQAAAGFKAVQARNWAEQAAKTLTEVAATRTVQGQPASKALLGTAIAVASVLDTVTNPTMPTTLLELINREPRTSRTSGDTDGNAFSYLFESAKTDAASTVADGGQKPTSGVTWSEKRDRYRVFATLSEAFPERYLDDYAGLLDILSRRLGEFIVDEIESVVIHGDDTAAAPKDEWDGLSNIAGVQTVAAAADLVQTVKNAKLALTTLGHQPTALALAPADLLRFEMLKSTTNEYLFPGGRKQIAEFLGVGAVVESTKLTAATASVFGEAWIGDWSQATLLVRDDTQLKVIQPGTLAETNQFKFRVEGRFGFKVARPAAFASVALPKLP